MIEKESTILTDVAIYHPFANDVAIPEDGVDSLEQVPLHDPKRQTDKSDISIFGSDVEGKWSENEEDNNKGDDGGCQRPHFVNRDKMMLTGGDKSRTGRVLQSARWRGSRVDYFRKSFVCRCGRRERHQNREEEEKREGARKGMRRREKGNRRSSRPD